MHWKARGEEEVLVPLAIWTSTFTQLEKVKFLCKSLILQMYSWVSLAVMSKSGSVAPVIWQQAD